MSLPLSNKRSQLINKQILMFVWGQGENYSTRNTEASPQAYCSYTTEILPDFAHISLSTILILAKTLPSIFNLDVTFFEC